MKKNFFSLLSWHNPIGMDGVDVGFIWELDHKGKHAYTALRTIILP
jgi:hypothetical protein